jgi:hypothetical protein
MIYEKLIFILGALFVMSRLGVAQENTRNSVAANKNDLKYHIEQAEYYFERANGNYTDINYRYAIREYMAALRIDDSIEDIYYQICLCYMGLGNVDQVDYWHNAYKKLKFADKDRVTDLGKFIKEFKQSIEKDKKASKINWRNWKMKDHTGYLGIGYGYADTEYEKGNMLYGALQHTFALELGINIGENGFSVVIGAGAYYIPKGNTFVSDPNYRWSFILPEVGVRYITKYPLFYIGKINFRYTGFAGVEYEFLGEGGEPVGGYEDKNSIGNSLGYKVSSGLFISNKDIPRGMRVEILYQGHHQWKDNAPVKYKPYFGIQAGFYFAIH